MDLLPRWLAFPVYTFQDPAWVFCGILLLKFCLLLWLYKKVARQLTQWQKIILAVLFTLSVTTLFFALLSFLTCSGLECIGGSLLDVIGSGVLFALIFFMAVVSFSSITKIGVARFLLYILIGLGIDALCIIILF